MGSVIILEIKGNAAQSPVSRFPEVEMDLFLQQHGRSSRGEIEHSWREMSTDMTSGSGRLDSGRRPEEENDQRYCFRRGAFWVWLFVCKWAMPERDDGGHADL